MVSTTQKGNYYKYKTRRFFEARGYICKYSEQYKTYYNTKMKAVGFHKYDLFGADIIAMDGREILFINSLFNQDSLSSHVNEHRKRFNSYPFPKSPIIKRIIAVWTYRKRKPKLYEVLHDE